MRESDIRCASEDRTTKICVDDIADLLFLTSCVGDTVGLAEGDLLGLEVVFGSSTGLSLGEVVGGSFGYRRRSGKEILEN